MLLSAALQFTTVHATVRCCAVAGASKATHVFYAVNAQLGGAARHSLPDLANMDVRNASRRLVNHEAPLQLQHWPAVIKAHPFQASLSPILCL